MLNVPTLIGCRDRAILALLIQPLHVR